MAVATGTALLVAAGMAAASSAYSAQEQKKAQKKSANLQQQQAMEARRIAAEQKPMEEAATLQTNTEGSVLGNLGLAIDADYSKKKPSSLGGVSTTTSGLGFGS